MSAKPFLDSNVIVYAFSADDPRSGPARDLVLDGAVVSVQVLNEFVNVSRKKLYRDWSEIQTCLALLASWLDEPRPLTLGTHRHAVDLAQRHGFSIYDA
jgi:predicted nucleic acid-binding protein